MRKSPLDMNLSERKVDLALRLYVDPADQDYISARIAYNNGLFYDFYWCAAQACEKYMKAYLLLQEQSSQSYNHDLLKLFGKVSELDSQNVIPESIKIPKTSAMGREAWQGKPPSLYIDYLSQYGSADNRYASHGTFVNGPVLHALDVICYALRRIMNHSKLGGENFFDKQNAELFFDEKINDRQGWMIDPTLLLERLFVNRYQVGQDQKLRAAFSNMNFSFFRERTSEESSFGGQHFHGSPLFNHLVRLKKLKPTSENVSTIDQLRSWASENITISRNVRKLLDLPLAPKRS